MSRQKLWFKSLSEVPGAAYQGNADLRARLPERNVTPTVEKFDRETLLMWPDGSSPVHKMWTSLDADASTPLLREQVLIALELPGELLDYHFVIQNTAGALWRRRRREPEQIAMAEWLWWVDARLIEAHPSMIRISDEKPDVFSVNAFDQLVDLYETEGLLREALAAAERFHRLSPRQDVVASLRERLANLEAEHA